jgi:hypothetical protein
MVLVRETATCRVCMTEVPLVLWGIHQEAHLLEHKEPDYRLPYAIVTIAFIVVAAIIILR